MTKIKIGTINCQNNEDNRLDRNNNAELLAQHILEEEYDILGLQELTIPYHNNIKNYLDDYHFYGKYQYGKGIIGTKIPIIKSYNQANKIVTPYHIRKTKTYAMPWIPYSIRDLIKALKKCCLTRRTITRVDIDMSSNIVFIFNTHLDYYIPRLQKRQLKYLLKKINRYKEKGKIVILGDFNLHIDDEIFISFIQELEKINIIRVPVNDKTNAAHYKDTTAIDHIFIPREWELLSCGSIPTEELHNITDHKAVYVEVNIPDYDK